MSSDFFLFDEPIFNYQPHFDSFLQEISTTEAQKQSLDEIAQTLLSDSSPTHEMESLSLNHLQDCSFSDIKMEDSSVPMGFGSLPSSNGFFCGGHSYEGESFMNKFMERSHSYGGGGALFQPTFGALFQSSENGFSCGQSSGLIRRVSSTGDLPKMRSNQATTQNVGSSLLRSESSTTILMDEANFKVGRYNAEVRKEKIDRYRAKRTQRNFNKTIKYACRKTLADNRLRVRGRFARNDESGEIARPSARYDDEDDLSVDGLHEEGEHFGKVYGYGVHGDHGVQRGQFMNHFEGYFSQFEENNFGY